MTQFAQQSTGIASDAITVIAASGRRHADDFADDVRAGCIFTAQCKNMGWKNYNQEAEEKMAKVAAVCWYVHTGR